MKNTFLTIALFMAILTFSQTKQEAINLVNEKAPKHCTTFGEYFQQYSTTEINDDGSFTITVVYLGATSTLSHVPQGIIVTKGFLRDLDLETIKLVNYEFNGFVIINCLNGADCLEVTKTGQMGAYTSKKQAFFGAFNVYQESEGKELKKNFKDLLGLYASEK